MNIHTVTKKFFVAAALLMFAVVQAAAFQFSPISQNFAASGQDTNKTFRASNNTEKPIAVQVEVQHRELDIDGNETLRDASNLFTVFPKQSVIQPGSYQTIYVRWNGPRQVSEEQEFRIIARQLPVDFSEDTETVNINILFVYKGTIYVRPESPDYNVIIDSVRQVTKNGESYIELILENTGNSHTFLQEPQLLLRTTGTAGTAASSVTLAGDKLDVLKGENIFAGQKRRFLIPWPEGLAQGTIDAELSTGYTQ